MKELAQKVNADSNFGKEAIAYVKRQLDEETAKPYRKRDYDRITVLNEELCELLDMERIDSTESKNKLYGRIAEYERKDRKTARAMKKVFPAVCCTVALIAANCYTVFAYDMNIVSAVIEFTRGGFTVSFDKDETVSLPTSEADPYGIIVECAKYDIYPETPHYLPEGFILTDIDNDVSSYSNFAEFVFRSSKDSSITFTYTRYWGQTDKIGIPSDDYNISETEVNGKAAVVSKEDNQYTITYQDGDTVFFMFTQDVSYDECEKIVASIE